MANTRGNVKLTFGKTTREQGFNLGELKSAKLKGNALYREACKVIIPRAVFRVWGPKTSFAMTEVEMDEKAGTTFKATGFIVKPLHGFNDKDQCVFETDNVPVTVEFVMPSDEDESAA